MKHRQTSPLSMVPSGGSYPGPTPQRLDVFDGLEVPSLERQEVNHPLISTLFDHHH